MTSPANHARVDQADDVTWTEHVSATATADKRTIDNHSDYEYVYNIQYNTIQYNIRLIRLDRTQAIQ